MKKLFLGGVLITLAATGCAHNTNHPKTAEVMTAERTAAGARPAGRDPEITKNRPAPERGVVEGRSARLEDLRLIIPKGKGEGSKRIESNLTEAEIAELQRRAQLLRPSDRLDYMKPAGDFGMAPNPGTNFDSIDVTECCGTGTLNPPDPELAAGPGHLIAVVNSAIEIYDTGGTSLFGPTNLETFFGPAGAGCTIFAFDPNALYDEDADRFIVGADGNGTEYCVAVSQTGDPTGAWNFYAFATNVGGAFFDFPHAGVGRDALYMGGNMFGTGTGRVWAFDKNAMYAGGAATFVSHDTTTNRTPQPINLHGALQGTWPNAGPHFILTSRTDFGTPGDFGLFTWDDPFGADTLTDVATLDIDAAHGVAVGFPVTSPQSGGGNVTANDNRGLDFEYRNGRGYMTNTVSCNPGGGTVNCVQWAEINLDAATVLQAGVFGSDDEFRYFPDLAADHCGNIAVGYSRSTATTFPGVWMTGREAGDPAGTMQPEIMIHDGEVTFDEPDRWGDYTGMTIAPDGQTFWYLGEYAKAGMGTTRNWGTWIGSGSYPCDTTPPHYWTHDDGNSGNGSIHWWNISADDRYVVGDFNGDGHDELLAINPSNGWHHTIRYNGSSWQWIEGNGSGQIHWWNISADDHYVAGDFNGDGRDELLAINPANGWHHTMRFNGSSWQHIEGGSSGQIGLWFTSTDDHFLAGDFDGNGRDELLSINPANGWHHTTRFNGSSWQWFQGGSGGQIHWWLLATNDWYNAGDYNGDGRDELLAINPNGWHHVMRYNGSSYQNIGGSGSGQIHWWFINPPDAFRTGDYDGNSRADLLAINWSNGWSHTIGFPGTAFQWMAGNSGSGQMGFWNFGSQDSHLPGDFDGDGRDEMMNINPNGWWHLNSFP